MDLFSKPRPESKALTVTQLMRRMKNLLEVQIGEVWVEGEVSNLRKQGSGHWYFSLKDAGAQISCAMFGARRKEGSEALEDGAKVRVFAEASVYEARGQLQIIVIRAERAGLGDLQARFEALKAKLLAEGLFDRSRKKPLPFFPMKIGLVTSETGAALQDMLNVLSRRAPWVTAVLFPVQVQGRGAEHGIAHAIRMMGGSETHGLPRCDVLIVGRGGGSIEDLWNFNEEVVARAIAACPIPVVSAVGHEIDFTIADFVADVRAPTPSAAAELVTPDGAELRERLAQRERRMKRRVIEVFQSANRTLEELKRGPLGRDAERSLREPLLRMERLRGKLEARSPDALVKRREETLAYIRARFERATAEGVSRAGSHLTNAAAMLRALGPESTFQRGFSLTTGPDGKVVKSAGILRAGDRLVTRFAEGSVESTVVKTSAG